MVDIVLLFGKFLLLALLYLFLIAAIRAGLRMVSAGTGGKGPRKLALAVSRGPAELRGVKLPVEGPIVIGRAADADLVIANDFVSSRHAQVTPGPSGPVLEDLGSTNGTLLNGKRVRGQVGMSLGDVIDLGPVSLKLVRL